jgi:hypothetical protein
MMSFSERASPCANSATALGILMAAPARNRGWLKALKAG